MLVEDTRQGSLQGKAGPRKAAHCLLKEVGQNIKHKKRDKRGRDVDPSREGSLKKERFPNIRKYSLWWVCGEPWNLRGHNNREKK